MIVNARKWEHAKLAELRAYEAAEAAQFEKQLREPLRRYLSALRLLSEVAYYGEARTETMAGAVATGAFESQAPSYSGRALAWITREASYINKSAERLEDKIARVVDGEKRDAA